MKRKITPLYQNFRPYLRDEIQNALDRVVEHDFVEDIEPERHIINSIPFYKKPYIKVKSCAGTVLRVSVHSIDKLGRGIGYIVKVKCKDWGLAGYEGVKKAIETIVPNRFPEPEFT